MHDAQSRPLKIGDRVLIPCTITQLHPTEDYCNVDLETVHGRRPDGSTERISAINTGVLLRANPGDKNTHKTSVAPIGSNTPLEQEHEYETEEQEEEQEEEHEQDTHAGKRRGRLPKPK